MEYIKDDVPAHIASPTYPEMLAAGIVLYAAQNTDVWEKLHALLDPVYYPYDTAGALYDNTFSETIRLLVPMSEEQALKRAWWIMHEASSQAARRMLKEALEEHPRNDPKAVVLGIAIGVLPVGVFGHHKPKNEVTIIIRNDTPLHDPELPGHAAGVSLDLFARALANADRNIQKMDPDMSDWFFGGRALNICTGDAAALSDIERAFSNNDILCASYEDGRGAAVLAVSPAVNTDTLSLDWNLEPIGT